MNWADASGGQKTPFCVRNRFLRIVVCLILILLICACLLFAVILWNNSHAPAAAPLFSSLSEPSPSASSVASAQYFYAPAIYDEQDVSPHPAAVAMHALQTTVYVCAGSADSYREGSGVLITEDGYILTNAHVISGYDTIKIRAYGHALAPARVIGVSSETDMALLKTDAENLPAAVIGTPASAELADSILLSGNPGGNKFKSTITMGVVSALDRCVTINGISSVSAIQCDAAVNPGSSGGGMFNIRGELIGIIAAKYEKASYEGIGFAIPIDTALNAVCSEYSLDLKHGSGHLGIDFSFINTARAKKLGVPAGCLVESSSNDVFLPGDILMAIDSAYLLEPENIGDYLLGKSPGDTVRVSVYRSSQTVQVNVTLR